MDYGKPYLTMVSKEKIFPGTYFFNLMAYITFYLGASNLLFKIIFGAFAILGSFALTTSYLKGFLLKELEDEHLKDKWLPYKKTILYVMTYFTISVYFSYFPILFISFSQMIFLFILVGFEFPDEPPKKKEEKQENGSWLAKLLPSKPVIEV